MKASCGDEASIQLISLAERMEVSRVAEAAGKGHNFIPTF
jgi:hypothetical protein